MRTLRAIPWRVQDWLIASIAVGMFVSGALGLYAYRERQTRTKLSSELHELRSWNEMLREENFQLTAQNAHLNALQRHHHHAINAYQSLENRGLLLAKPGGMAVDVPWDTTVSDFALLSEDMQISVCLRFVEVFQPKESDPTWKRELARQWRDEIRMVTASAYYGGNAMFDMKLQEILPIIREKMAILHKQK